MPGRESVPPREREPQRDNLTVPFLTEGLAGEVYEAQQTGAINQAPSPDPRALARDFIRVCVERGETEQQLNASWLGCATEAYWAEIRNHTLSVFNIPGLEGKFTFKLPDLVNDIQREKEARENGTEPPPVQGRLF